MLAHWKKKGYPSVKSDLESAFQKIQKDVMACDCRNAERTSAILLEAIGPDRRVYLHKYRCKDKASGEGASGGWRFYAVFDKDTNVLYPIIVYPHKQWQDASEDYIKDCVNELISIIKQREFPE